MGDTWGPWGPVRFSGYVPLPLLLSLSPATLSSHYGHLTRAGWVQVLLPSSVLKPSCGTIGVWPTTQQGLPNTPPPLGRMSSFALRKGKQP